MLSQYGSNIANVRVAQRCHVKVRVGQRHQVHYRANKAMMEAKLVLFVNLGWG